MDIASLHQLFLKGNTVCTDTRELTPNCIFFALKGENFNGNTFAKDALQKGAYDFIQKPLDLNRTLVSIRNAFERSDLVEETKTLKRKLSKNKITEIIGESEGIEQIKEMIHKVAASDARVLVTGGNGTGKELVARQLHEKSNRAKGPFIEVNCAAIPAELIESEL